MDLTTKIVLVISGTVVLAILTGVVGCEINNNKFISNGYHQEPVYKQEYERMRWVK